MWIPRLLMVLLVTCALTTDVTGTEARQGQSRSPVFPLSAGGMDAPPASPLVTEELSGKVQAALENVLKMKSNLDQTRHLVTSQPHFDVGDLARFTEALDHMTRRVDLPAMEKRLITLSDLSGGESPPQVLQELAGYERALTALNRQCMKVTMQAIARNLVQEHRRHKRSLREDFDFKLDLSDDEAVTQFESVSGQVDELRGDFNSFLASVTEQTGSVSDSVRVELAKLEKVFEEQVKDKYSYYRVNQHCTDDKDVQSISSVVATLRSRLGEMKRQLLEGTTVLATSPTTQPPATSSTQGPLANQGNTDSLTVMNLLKSVLARVAPLKARLPSVYAHVAKYRDQGRISSQQARDFHLRVTRLAETMDRDTEKYLKPLQGKTGAFPPGTLQALWRVQSDFDDIEEGFEEICTQLAAAAAAGNTQTQDTGTSELGGATGKVGGVGRWSVQRRGRRDITQTDKHTADRMVRVFRLMDRRVRQVSVRIDQSVRLLSALYKRTGQIPDDARAELDAIQDRLRQEVFPAFSYYRVNQHCTERREIKRMGRALRDMGESLRLLESDLQQAMVAAVKPTPPTPASNLTSEPTARDKPQGDTGTGEALGAGLSGIRRGLSGLRDTVQRYQAAGIVSGEQAEILRQRIARLEQVLARDVTQTLSDIQHEFNSISRDLEQARLSQAGKRNHGSRVRRELEDTSADPDSDLEPDESALMAAVHQMKEDVQDSVDGALQQDRSKVKKTGIIAAIFSIFGLLTVAVYVAYLVHYCRKRKRRKQAEQEQLVQSASKYSYKSPRTSRPAL